MPLGRRTLPVPIFTSSLLMADAPHGRELPTTASSVSTEQASQSKPFQLHYRGDDIKKEWAGQGDVEVVAYLAWSDLRMPIVDVDETAHLATLGSDPAPSNREVDARYFIENAPDALDAPGEWYLDKTTGKVSYIPLQGENMERALVVAPTVERLCRCRESLNREHLCAMWFFAA